MIPAGSTCLFIILLVTLVFSLVRWIDWLIDWLIVWLLQLINWLIGVNAVNPLFADNAIGIRKLFNESQLFLTTNWLSIFLTRTLICFMLCLAFCHYCLQIACIFFGIDRVWNALPLGVEDMGIYGLSSGVAGNLSWGALLRSEGPKFKAEGRDREGEVLGRGSESLPHQLGGQGELCKLPQRGSRLSPDRKCILDALRAQNASSVWKCRFVVVNRHVLNHVQNLHNLQATTHLGGATAPGAPPCLRHWAIPQASRFSLSDNHWFEYVTLGLFREFLKVEMVP